MTGLVPELDVILEVAAEVTDGSFMTLASYEARANHPKDVVVARMQANTWWAGYPENRDDFIHGLSGGKPIAEIEKELIALVERHFGNEPALLAGNSIHNDRLFIKQWMPELNLKLHYRMLDVTSWKIVMQSKFNLDYKKPGVHRAFEDIQASIAELQYYLDYFEAEAGKRHDP